MALPPLTIIASTNTSFIADAYKNYSDSVRFFEVVEDFWGDVKDLIASRCLSAVGHGLLKELLEQLSLELTYSEGSRCCLIIDKDAGLSINKYEGEVINNPHVACIANALNTTLKHVRGKVRFYWSNHPLLYGLGIGGKYLEIHVGELNALRRLKVLGKPIVFIGGEPLVLELPYNRSIVFLGLDRVISEMALRSLFYTC